MGSLGDKFVNFDQELITHWIFGWQSKCFRGRWVKSEVKKGVLRTLYIAYLQIWEWPSQFQLYFNLNRIKDLWVTLISATPAGGHKCIKKHFECQSKSGNQRHPAKVLNSDFCLCPRSKPHLQNYLIDSKDFGTRTAQGRGHIKSKIKSLIWRTHF